MPVFRYSDTVAHYFTIFDDYKLVFVAINSDTDVVSFFELFMRNDASDLKCAMSYFTLVEEEFSSKISERIVGLANCELIRVIFGN